MADVTAAQWASRWRAVLRIADGLELNAAGGGPSQIRHAAAHLRAIAGPSLLDLVDADSEPLECDCVGVDFGTYANVVDLMPPEGLGITRVPVAVDRCIADEVQSLWRLGIRTTGSCCGHNKGAPFINVAPEFIGHMKGLGYRVALNTCRPGDEDSFTPLSLRPRGPVRPPLPRRPAVYLLPDEPVICKGCGAKLTGSPDTNQIRLYWTCQSLTCPWFRREQKVEYVCENLARRTVRGALPLRLGQREHQRRRRSREQ